MKPEPKTAHGSAIPLEELKAAMAEDFDQHMTNSYTPQRGYPFPTDNVQALIAKYWPNDQAQRPGDQNA